MRKALLFISTALIVLISSGSAAITETFDTYPSGGSGWNASWVTSAGESIATASVESTNPLNGGGNYLSVSTSTAKPDTGIRRNIGSLGASDYTLTFDWRYDGDITTFNSYYDRIHFGATPGTSLGTSNTFTWIIGVVGGDDGNSKFSDGEWYFYNGVSDSLTVDNGFNSANMKTTGIFLESGVTYSFTVTVNAAAQTYSATIAPSNAPAFSASDLNFRNQETSGGNRSTNASNLIFGGSNTGPGHTLDWSIDNIVIIPEPSSLLLAGLSSLLCFARRRIVH
jgi:hypothetical protein